jgi:2-polyprenyl-3-methyl-5-hydroxy-6-metoxy-1,4-benzoquinol methylase
MTSRVEFIESSKYTASGLRACHSYLVPSLMKHCADAGVGTRVLDVGCGNGAVAGEFVKRGCTVVGIDMAEPGIRIAREASPAARFEILPADQDVLTNLNEAPFDIVYSLEVVEHLYDPRGFLVGCFTAAKNGGTFICSTPYHGYLKNLAISLIDGWDQHHNPGFDGGHIKFFSRKTLSDLLLQVGFHACCFSGAGRIPYLWNSMVIAASKPYSV